jgi:hypothetical protein
MAYFLPSNSDADPDQSPDLVPTEPAEADISDMRIFWGPEICRLEYLLHLMETGRIVDEYSRVHA